MNLLTSIVSKQHKSLKAKIGGAVDETQDDVEDEEEKRAAWGPGKNIYYVNDKKVIIITAYCYMLEPIIFWLQVVENMINEVY